MENEGNAHGTHIDTHKHTSTQARLTAAAYWKEDASNVANGNSNCVRILKKLHFFTPFSGELHLIHLHVVLWYYNKWLHWQAIFVIPCNHENYYLKICLLEDPLYYNTWYVTFSVFCLSIYQSFYRFVYPAVRFLAFTFIFISVLLYEELETIIFHEKSYAYVKHNLCSL